MHNLAAEGLTNCSVGSTWREGRMLPTPVDHDRKYDLEEIANLFSELHTWRMEVDSISNLFVCFIK